jgi:uncharacterized protein (TIGR03083 family)
METQSETETDWGALYREHVADLAAMATGLSDDDQRVAVPGTPAWTVHDVFAHLAGGASDGVTGRMDGAPAPEWTARHVGERQQLPLADLVSELQSHQDAIAESTVGNPRPAVVWDIAVHHADLHEALGRRQLAPALWEPVLAAVGPWRAESIVDEVAPYELFRGLFSRRSRAQMLAWGTPLSAAELDEVCVFGPREDDQPVPA